MYALGERIALPPQLEGIFDAGGLVDKVKGFLTDAQSGAQQASAAINAVKSGDAQVKVVPTPQGIQKAVASSPYTPYVLAGAGVLALMLLMKRR